MARIDVDVFSPQKREFNIVEPTKDTHTHTRTHMYMIYTYIYIYMYIYIIHRGMQTINMVISYGTH